MTTRTRFAPSPTGYFHLGSARTALFAWLFARHTHGQFVLRVEDTDKARESDDALEHILKGMRWLGLNWDEGPFFQSERLDRYQEVIQSLLDSGDAYRCICTSERLDALREAQIQAKQKPKYDGHCRHANIDADCDQPFVVRFANPLEGYVQFEDQVHGSISVDNRQLDDLIIARNDHSPTYNLTVVVDDFDMQITHVIRGDDHLNNTPRQINILKALNASIPTYAHVPMIMGPDGKKLSKRHGAASILEYQQQGIFPLAMLNLLVRLGWSHGNQETFTLDEMIRLFDLGGLNASAARFNPERLAWLNQLVLKQLKHEELLPMLASHGINTHDPTRLSILIDALKDRCSQFSDLLHLIQLFEQSEIEMDLQAKAKFLQAETVALLKHYMVELKALEGWNEARLAETLKTFTATHGVKMGKVAPALRLAVTGQVIQLPANLTLALIGKEKVIRALDNL